MPDDLFTRLSEEARGSRRSAGARAIEILDPELRGRGELTLDELRARARRIRTRASGIGPTRVADEVRADRERSL
jgi:hypothetical protein